MHGSKPVLIVIFILCLQTFFACDGNSPANNDNRGTNSVTSGDVQVPADQANDNIEELGSIINLPFEPDEVAWKDDNANLPGGKARKLVAVLRFSPENAKRVIAEAAKLGTGISGTRGTETWYPAELISQGEIGGDDAVNVITYSAADFLRSPFIDGKLSSVENSDYFILELLTNKAAP